MTTLLPALVMMLLVVLRALEIDSALGSYSNCADCYLLPTLAADAWLLGLVLALLGIGCLAAWRWLRLLARLVAVALILLLALDLSLLYLMSQRLHLGDVARFGGELSSNLSVFKASLSSSSGALKLLAITLGLGVLTAGCWPGPQHKRFGLGLLGLALLACTGAQVLQILNPVQFVHHAYIDNVLSINLSNSSVRKFSSDYIANQRSVLAKTPTLCEQNENPAKPDLIILIAESLSSWQSHLLEGTHDWLPRLDAIARENHYFTHFHANGFSTSGAQVALGTGLVPINPPGVFEYTLDHYTDVHPSLADIAHSANYRALYFMSNNSKFFGLEHWLRSLNFDDVHGSSDPYYRGMKLWQFDSVEDRLLYQRFLDWFDHRPVDQRFASVLLTVSSHPPFVNPETGQLDAEGTFRYVDTQIGAFYDALNSRGFFKHGLLVILGDHRSMTPLQANEYQSYGERAFARIPMVIAGNVDMPKVVDEAFQQYDLLPSLAWQLGVPYCRLPYAGSFLKPNPEPPSLVVHARGDNRSRVDIYTGETAVFSYLLDGDNSDWLGPAPPDAQAISAWIDVQRADAGLRAKKIPRPN